MTSLSREAGGLGEEFPGRENGIMIVDIERNEVEGRMISEWDAGLLNINPTYEVE